MYSKRLNTSLLLFVFIVLNFALTSPAAQQLHAVKVSGGEQHTLIVADNNEVFAAGANYYGQIGNGDTTDQYTLVRVKKGEMSTSTGFLENITAISAGWKHSIFLENDGRVLACGNNYYGELGNPNYSYATTPVWVHAGEQNPSYPDSNLCNIICITAGRSGQHSLAVDTNGLCLSWGLNDMGQLGINQSNNSKNVPQKILGGQMGTQYLQNIIAVSAGEQHSMALASDGSVYCFGDNAFGKIGVNTTSPTYYTTPQKVHGVNNVGFLADINSISAGWDHCMALEKIDAADPNCKGRVYCWGNNGEGYDGEGGRLGDGNSTGISATPVLVKAGEQNPGNPTGTYLEGIVAIAAGESHSMMLDANGFVYCVGDNKYGQLGNGTWDPCATPVKVLGFNGQGYLSNIIAISAGYWHCLAVDASGQLWTWGDWASGKLGIATTSDKNTPYPVPLSDPNVWNKTQNHYYTTIQFAINYADNNDVLVAYPGIYTENVDFNSVSSKVLTLKSANPADPLTVAQTIIKGSSGNYTVTFSNNSSTLNGFTLAGGSYGVYCTGGGPTIANCLIRNNTVAGVSCTGLAAPTIENCIIKDNVYMGGFTGISIGIQCSNAGQAKILNNIIVNNYNLPSHGHGYGISIENTDNQLTIRNNTISRNNYGISRSGGTADPNISNCIIYDNGSYELYYDGGAFNNVNYCCIKGGYGNQTNHNISADPCFVAADADNYHLKFGSLCRNAGDPNRSYAGEYDIDSQNRRNGTGRVDIGADEYFSNGDLNNDEMVDFLDYAIFANAWKTQPSDANWNPICDLIDNNNIDINDLSWFCQSWPSTEPEASATGMDEEPQPLSMMEESEFPPIYMTCDNNMPEPNQEVTVYVHSDTPLYIIEVIATITGDVNVTAALNPDDCNQYGWDPSWEFGPCLDLDTFGFVYFVGLSWPDESSSGVVGYLKFIYHGGQVVVSIVDGGSTIDTNWESVPFSTDVLTIGESDPNNP